MYLSIQKKKKAFKIKNLVSLFDFKIIFILIIVLFNSLNSKISWSILLLNMLGL